MKKYILVLISILALASCTQKDAVQNPENTNNSGTTSLS